MIQLYSKGTTDFSKNGIELHPKESTVTFADNGQYDLEIVVPAGKGYTNFDYGQILRATVPTQEMDAVNLGIVSYYTVTNIGGTNLLASVPVTTYYSYNPWTTGVNYDVGANVTSGGQNYTCTYAHRSDSSNAPAGAPSLWSAIANTTTTGGHVIGALAYNSTVMKIKDFNADYMEAATLTGGQGYVKKADCTATGQSESRTLPARTISEQNFIVTEIRKEQNGQSIRVSAEHVSYQLGRTVLGDCNVVGVNPATAIMFIQGAMKESYSGSIYTNISGITIDADWSWKNAQTALLDPKSGLLNLTGGHMVRDDLDVFILAEGTPTPKYSVRYGSNMKSVKWTGDVSSIVTRIYPTAQTEDGRTLLLPEEHVDTARTIPFVKPEVLNTGMKVGQKVTNSDGTETELTEDEIYSRMRTEASNRFNIDKCDMAEVKLELDWVHIPATEEYAQYSDLANAAPGDWVEVQNGPLGISEMIRLSGYTWDPMTETYKSTTFGDIKTKATVAGYNIKSGSVTARALAANSVSGANIQQSSITAREIAAHSITSDMIASQTIITDLLAANAVTADQINAGSVTADKVAAGAITTVKLAAEAVTAEKIDAGAITADKIDANAVTSEKIYAGAITSGKIAAGAVTAVAIDAGAVTAMAIASDAVTSDKIFAGAVTADKIYSGAVTADKIGALAVTAGKIAANAVTADTIASGSISASKIDTSDLAALNATLGTASIARAEIASADIDYAQVKDLAAETAIFSTTVTEQGVADRLYINRLLITYGQMVEATIGDLIIGDDDGNYYHIDVEWDEDGVPTLVPTQVATPTAAEIASGHTSDGQTIIGDIGTYAELSSEDFYAINAIIDRITARRIDVDELWARQAFINKLMVQDISSNTYIQSTIGNWQSQSTITQTVAGLESRISSLGYGTIYYSITEPEHENLVLGDIWVQPLEDNTWQDYEESEWQDIIDGGTWGDVVGAYKVYTWGGQFFKLLFDNTVNVEMWTAIEQNTAAIALKANQTDLNVLSGEVTEFQATLEVQAQEISAAVSSVNSKVTSTLSWEAPTTHTLGDIWIKSQDDFGTWLITKDSTWQDLKDKYVWKDALGTETYVWNGSDWILSSDGASDVYQRTLIDQTSTQITLLAETDAKIEGEMYRLGASITLTAERIEQEVFRATTAESGKIDKTSQYQTADEIVSEAVSQANSAAQGSYIAKTTMYQTAEEIVTEAVMQSASSAAGIYLAKTSTYQTADSIVTEAVRQSSVIAGNAYLAKTSTYQTADAIVAEAVRQSSATLAGAFIAKTTAYQDANSIVLTAETYADGTASTALSNAKSYADNNFYGLKSGVSITSSGVEISGGKYIKILSGSTVKMLLNDTGIDMQTAGKFYLHAQDASNSAIIFGTNKASANFYVGNSGDVVANSLTVNDLTVNGSGLPRIVISETQPSSGSDIIWIKPSSASEKTWNFRPSSLVLDNTGGTLGYYKDFTCSYSADDYLSGNLFYGIKARLYFYNLSTYSSRSFKARLKNGNSWIDLGSVTDFVQTGRTLVLDVMTSSATTNIMNVSGGTFTIRLETNAPSGEAMLLNEDVIFKAKNTSTGSFASCTVFYKQ